jgi:lysyl-tRNA synthetase class I
MIQKIKVNPTLIIFILLGMIFFACPAFSKEPLNIEELMTHKEFKDSGLADLTPDQIKALNDWLNRFTVTKKKLKARKQERLERKQERLERKQERLERKQERLERKNVKKNSFQINNRIYEKLRDCKGFKKGDKIRFIQGSAHGLCETATIVKKGTKKSCQLWCVDGRYDDP